MNTRPDFEELLEEVVDKFDEALELGLVVASGIGQEPNTHHPAAVIQFNTTITEDQINSCITAIRNTLGEFGKEEGPLLTLLTVSKKLYLWFNPAGYDPVLISLLRRAMPQMMAFDVCGVQPMKAPSGLVFALKVEIENKDDNTEG